MLSKSSNSEPISEPPCGGSRSSTIVGHWIAGIETPSATSSSSRLAMCFACSSSALCSSFSWSSFACFSFAALISFSCFAFAP